MVKTVVELLSKTFSDVVDFFPAGILLSLAAGCVADQKYFKAWKDELIGSMLMICFTFSAGKWIGKESWEVAWAWHVVGVILADKLGGGNQVNPAVTVSMWSLKKIDSYTEAFVRIAGQMGGGLLAFPLFDYVSDQMGWEPFGGPEFSSTGDHPVEEALSEFFATFLLMWAIYILNWEMNFGKFHYWIKQFLTAVAIRALIEAFPTAGPAMNPMLATAWAVFGGSSGAFPDDNEHYFVYWVAPFLAALLASVTWCIYSGEYFFGKRVPLGPIKSTTVVPGTKPPSKKKKKN